MAEFNAMYQSLRDVVTAQQASRAQMHQRLAGLKAQAAPSTNVPKGDTMAYKFKIGDRVRTVTDWPEGGTGVVTETPDQNGGLYRLVLDPDQVQSGLWNSHPSGTTMVVPPKPKVNVSFESVILPAEKKRLILDTISQVDNHEQIFVNWGFDAVMEKGKAISMLFYGLPGTGKTLMAQAIADKFGKELKFVNTADIETPEPGGAERNLRAAFENATKTGAVLLLDECDSLITDRSRVGMILAAQINSLLSELERFEGIAIFTTNRLGALDAAFERRLALKMEFPMPTAEHRIAIWQRMFPKKAPLETGIDWTALAEVEIAGGHIKNIVLASARRAANAGLDKITEAIIWEALEHEVAALKAYQAELERYNPYYGTPVVGGQGGKPQIARSRTENLISKESM
jgi:hypothetical protein